ncbi:MAG: hypothetical protein ARM1_0689 [Candidatus Micrarchaeota archaeon]|nr:MAG: hypothetical protein ARM1_0689 [Candidatus Micrarchaeota archaeon]
MRHRSILYKHRYTIALLIIIVFAAVYFSYNYIGPSFYGDDIVYDNLAYQVLSNRFYESSFIFSVRLLIFYPIALFYKLFGINIITDSIWDLIAYILTLVVVYIIGKDLYNEKAGLIAALLLIFVPFSSMLATTTSDDIISMLFTSLIFLFFIKAVKYKSRAYYAASGLSVIASILTTPEAYFVILVFFLYALIELIRKNIRLDNISAFFFIGLFIGLLIMMIVNYSLTYNNCNNTAISFSSYCRNPLITFTLSSSFYSKIGSNNTIPSTNIDPRFYLNTIFGYNILDIKDLTDSYYINSFSGFYFYLLYPLLFILLVIYKHKRSKKGLFYKRALYAAAVLALAALYWMLLPIQNSLSCNGYTIGYECKPELFLITSIPFIILLIFTFAFRKDSLYMPLFWLTFTLILLNYGPMHISLHPFIYLITYRLQRFLALVAPPLALSLAIVLAYMLDIRSRFNLISKAFSIIIILFLILTSYNVISFWNVYTESETFYQRAIAAYLNTYADNSTLIYFVPAASFLSTYMHFENLSRFIAITAALDSCSQIRNGSYVILKAISSYNPVFIQNTSACNLREILDPTYNTTNPEIEPYIMLGYQSFGVILYRKYGNSSEYNFFNLTGAGYKIYNRLISFTNVNTVRSVKVSVNRSYAAPGQPIAIDVTFYGSFGWYIHPRATYYYLHSKVINVHYYGVELANQTGILLDQNNGPWYYLIRQIAEPRTLISNNTVLEFQWIITPTYNLSDKSLKICGGYFAGYANTTAYRYGAIFDNLSKRQIYVDNSSVINIPSSNCDIVYVS